MRILARRCSALLAALSVCLCSSSLYAQSGATLNVYNWSDYIDPTLITEFEQEYGIKVNYDIYDSSEIVDTKLMTGRSGYDLVFHSASFSQRLIPIGVYHPIDFSRLKNCHHIDPLILQTLQKHFPG